VSELHDHLNTLAGRGTRRGADAVIAAAVADADAHDNVVPVALSEEQPRERRKGRSAFAAAGVAALLGVATLAIGALVGGNGADTPEAAVRQLADAISHEDPLAALDVISPDEVRTLRDTVDSASRKAEELELVDAAGAPFAGIDLSVDGLELETEDLAPGYVKVHATGGIIQGRTDRAGFSDFAQRAMGDHEGTDEGEIDLASLETDGPEPFVVVVERDGSWYVSVAYTALEYVRESEGGAPADYGSARAQAASLGADSPEAAARDMLDAVAAGNWERVLELVPPDEIPVYDYRAWILDAAAESEPNMTVDEFEVVSTETAGDTALVTVQVAVSYTDEYDGETYTTRLADDCAASVYYGFFFEEANGESCLSVLSFVPFARFNTNDLGRGEDNVRVTAVQRDGRWFLSPVGTALDYLDEALDRIDRDWLYVTFGLAYEIEPEAALTLGQAIEPQGGVRVFSLEGRAGQEIIGVVGTEDNNGYSSAEIYAPDGENLDAWGLFDGESVTLPVDGTYKVVVYEYSQFPYTIWDVADAPAYALEPRYIEDEYDDSASVTVEDVAPLPTPDETVALGQPLTVDVVDEFSRVYAFAGVAGQQIVGKLVAPAGTGYGFYTTLIGPDGSVIDGGDVLFDGGPVTLPLDGTYTVIVTLTGNGSFGFTFSGSATAPGDSVGAPPTPAIPQLAPNPTGP